jgi:hypothetical protein
MSYKSEADCATPVAFHISRKYNQGKDSGGLDLGSTTESPSTIGMHRGEGRASWATTPKIGIARFLQRCGRKLKNIVKYRWSHVSAFSVKAVEP